METVRDFIFLGSKITASGDCSHEIKRYLLLGRKAMTNLDSILKSRGITNKDLSSQGYGFSSSHVWMWELDCEESWALKDWCFELWCWRRLLRVPWMARRSNQSILKETGTGISLEYYYDQINCIILIYVSCIVKSLLMKVKVESEKVGLKLNIQKN